MPAVSDYYFYPALFLRTPVNSYDFYQNASIAKILKNSFFRSALLMASKSLYRELEKKEFNSDRFSENEKKSLQKYYNRMCYRPTPFGLFAGFSVVRWGATSSPLILQDQFKLHTHYSYQRSLAIAEECLDSQLMPLLFYAVNGSIYQVNDEYRYLRYEQRTGETKRKFFIDSFERSAPLESILFFCNSQWTKGELSKYLSEQFATDEEEACSFVDHLIEKQIIVPAIQPNVTGKDYLEAIWDLRRTSSANPVIPRVKTCPSVNVLGSVFTEPICLKELLGVDQIEGGDVPEKTSVLYVNLERPNVAGCLDKRHQEKILDGLYCINRLVQAHMPAGLQL